jgi:hypothetical protein
MVAISTSTCTGGRVHVSQGYFPKVRLPTSPSPPAKTEVLVLGMLAPCMVRAGKCRDLTPPFSSRTPDFPITVIARVPRLRRQPPSPFEPSQTPFPASASKCPSSARIAPPQVGFPSFTLSQRRCNPDALWWPLTLVNALTCANASRSFSMILLASDATSIPRTAHLGSTTDPAPYDGHGGKRQDGLGKFLVSSSLSCQHTPPRQRHADPAWRCPRRAHTPSQRRPDRISTFTFSPPLTNPTE